MNKQPVKSGDERVTATAVRFFYENLGRISTQQLLFPVIIGAVFYGSVSNVVLITWASIAASIYLARIALANRYLEVSPAPENQDRWERYFTLSAIASGITWGFAAWLFSVPGYPSSEILVYVMIVGTAAGSMLASVNVHWPWSFLGFTVPAVGIAIAHLIWSGGRFEYILSVMLGIFFIQLVQMGKRLKKQIYHGIQLQYANADLAEELQEKKDAAEAANRAKTRFLASANHDLRQPIHAMSMLVYALKNEVATRQGRNIHDQLTRASAHLNELLESLLDLSRLDAQTIEPQVSVFALQPLFNRLLAENLPTARAKDLRLRVHPSDAVVRSDPILVERILRNLLHNAVTYTQTGGILVGVRKRSGFVSVEVWDTGTGISHDEQHQIFREFFQASDSPPQTPGQTQGLGLGLAICQRLADLLGHELNFRSSKGAGSVFKVLLPPAQSAPIAALMPTSALATDPDLTGKTILIVDDDAHSLQAMTSLFQLWGADVLSAQDSNEALGFSHEPVDLILSDFHLGVAENGVDLVARLRARFGRPELPAIIVTGDTSKSKLEMLSASGLPVLHKPLQPDELIQAVNDAL